MKKKKKMNVPPKITFLWLIHVCLANGIVCWLVNPISRNIYLLTIMIILWLGIAILYDSKTISYIFLKKWYIWTYLWILILFIYFCLKHADFSFSYIMYIFCFGIGIYYINKNDVKAAIIISCMCIVYFLIIAFTTLKAYTFVPGLSRILANGDKSVIIKRGAGAYMTPFIAGYDAIYGFSELSVIILFCVLKKRMPKILKVILSGVAFFLMIVVIKAEYLFAVMITFIGLFLVLFSVINNIKIKIITIGISLLSILVFFIFGQYICSWLAVNISINNFSIRLKEMANLFARNSYSEGTDIGERFSLYSISILNFFEAPIFGKGTGILFKTFGNHSTILDILAKYGIVGGVPLFIYYIYPMKNILLKFNKTNKTGYRLLLVMIGILGLINIANTRVNYALVYIVCPLLLFWTENLIKNNK